MKKTIPLIVLACLVMVNLSMKKSRKIEPSCAVVNQTIYPYTLWAPGVRPGWVHDGTFFMFIEFVSEDSVCGYMGCHAYKGVGYAHQWLFYPKKISSSQYESERIHNLDYDDKRGIKIFKTDEGWFYEYDNHKPIKLENLNTQPCNQKTRKDIYIMSVLNRKRYVSKAPYGMNYYADCFSGPLFELPFNEFASKVNELSLEELYKLLCINPGQ